MNSKENEIVQEGTEQSASNTAENSQNNEQETTTENKESSNESQPLAELESKLAEEKDKYLRLYSEFDNFRKRTIKEKSDLIKAGGEDVFKIIIPIIDDFERAIKANEKATELDAVKEGIQLIYNKLYKSLQAKGLEPMDCTGKEFDADTMEAITQIPAPSEDMKGKVVDEVEKGYLLNGKVVRFAKVVTGS